MVPNFFTFDVEEWYHANYEGLQVSTLVKKQPTHLEALVERLIELCLEQHIPATFFVVGEIAQKKPNVVKMISEAGYELASHSYKHELVYEMGKKRFFYDAKKTKALLEDIAGQAVKGYRAPSWSVNTESLAWYYEGLIKAGYKYSSSVFPVKTFLYGIPDANPSPHIVSSKKGEIVEIPCSTFSLPYFSQKLGFSGGAYFRLLPKTGIQFISWVKNKRGEPIVYYLHPREIDLYQPKLQLAPQLSFLHYYGIKGTEKKLKEIMTKQRERCSMNLSEYSFSLLEEKKKHE